MNKVILGLILYLSNPSISLSQSTEVYGQWKLMSIESARVLKNIQKDFFLTIGKEKVSYNLELNGCSTDKPIITDKEISMPRVRCTMACCDLDFGKSLNYSGIYSVNGDTLRIENERIYIFVRNEK